RALIRAGARVHGRDPVLLVARVPGLDRTPGEDVLPIGLVGVDHAADVPDPRDDGVAGSKLDGAKHAHLQVGADSFHLDLLGLLAAAAAAPSRPPPFPAKE